MCVFITVYDCGTQYSTKAVLIIFTLILQTIITAQMTSIGGEGGPEFHNPQHSLPAGAVPPLTRLKYFDKL